MENLEIKVSRKTRMVELPKQFISVEGENLQNKLIFSFVDGFVNGQARLEYKRNGEKNYIVLDKENNTYTLPVKNVLTVEGQIDMQLVVTEGIDEEDIPVFKSNMFYLFCNSSINAVNEAPDGYKLWIEQANVKLNQIDEALLESETQSDYAKEQGDYAKEQGDYAKEQGEKIENVVVDLEETRNIAEQANSKSDTAISISKGANQALSYDDYQAMITNFNAFESERFNLGQQVMIRTLNVPDLWVYDYASEKIEYEYVSDENFVNTLREVGYVQVGWYLLAELETQKVDLTDYVKFNDFAGVRKPGVIQIYGSSTNGLAMNGEGFLYVAKATNWDIQERTNGFKPIVPATLDYAVGSVKASETQSGTAKMWTSVNEDGEVGLNISTEV